jgi:hypothetical protein
LGAAKAVSARTEPAKTESKPAPWVVRPHLSARNPALVLNLAASLPSGVKRGGRFYVDKSGAPLPPGVKLSPEGILSVTDKARAGTTKGVVFGYTEPS